MSVSNALFVVSKARSCLFNETISPTILIAPGVVSCALIFGYVSSIDFPEVFKSSIITTLSLSTRYLSFILSLKPRIICP